MNNELKSKYPKTWEKFKEYCKENLSKQKGLEAFAMFTDERSDEMATLVIAMNPAVITDFFDSEGIIMIIDSDGVNFGCKLVGESVEFKFSKRSEALVDSYKKSFTIYENKL